MWTMPNLANLLKAEISRLARKEMRGDATAVKKAVASYRHQIAEMKRRMLALEREVSRLRRGVAPATHTVSDPHSGSSLRFRPAGFAKHRQRLGLSAREMGLLLNASALSVYKWEQGQARPRQQHLESIAALRKMGKREAHARLEALTAE